MEQIVKILKKHTFSLSLFIIDQNQKMKFIIIEGWEKKNNPLLLLNKMKLSVL